MNESCECPPSAASIGAAVARAIRPRRAQQPGRRRRRRRSCCEQTLVLLQQMQRDQRFRTGQVHEEERPEYVQWLNTMRESVIVRNQTYEDYQEDWGGGRVSRSGSGSPITESSTAAFVEVLTVDSAFQVGTILNTGPNSIDVRAVIVDQFGNTATVTVLGVAAATFLQFSSVDLANQLLTNPCRFPIQSVEYSIRDNVAGFSGVASILFNWI